MLFPFVFLPEVVYLKKFFSLKLYLTKILVN